MTSNESEMVACIAALAVLVIATALIAGSDLSLILKVVTFLAAAIGQLAAIGSAYKAGRDRYD